MHSKYYYVKTEVDCDGVAHLPFNTVEFLVEVPFNKLSPSSSADSNDPEELAAAIGIAQDIARTKYPVENASYNMRKPTLELDPSSIITREDFITAKNGSKGWLIPFLRSDKQKWRRAFRAGQGGKAARYSRVATRFDNASVVAMGRWPMRGYALWFDLFYFENNDPF